MDVNWTTIIVAAVSAVLGGGLVGGIATFLTARAAAETTVAEAWAKYAGSLENRIAALGAQVDEMPTLRATVAEFGRQGFV